MTTSPQLEAAKSKTLALAVGGFTLAVLGMLSVAAPMVAGVSIAILVGVAVTVSGVVQIASIIKSDLATGGQRAIGIAVGGLTVLAGTLIVSHPLFGLRFMMIL